MLRLLSICLKTENEFARECLIIILEPLLRELCEMVEGQQESEAVEELNKEINDLNEQRLILSQVMRKGYMDSALFTKKQ